MSSADKPGNPAQRWMAYADGELDDAELEALEQELAADSRGPATVSAFTDLGALVREAVQAPPVDLTDAIMARLPEPSSLAAQAKVLDLAAARARRVRFGMAGAALVAAAAAVALWVGGQSSQGDHTVAVADDDQAGVAVDRIDSSNNITVISIPALHSNASSVVVWIGDDEDDDSPAAPPSHASPAGATP